MAKNWQHMAGVLWPALVDSAERRETRTYQQLAPIINTNPLSVRLALGPIQTFCLDEHLPALTAVVIGKNSRKPGASFIAWDVDDLESALEQVFSFDWKTVSNPYASFGPNDTVETLAQSVVDDPSRAKDVYALVKQRGIAQRIFRIVLGRAYENKCAFCGLGFETALEAAHIKPWGRSSREERIDPSNGLLLCATHHRLFDWDYIKLTPTYMISYYDPKQEEGPYSQADKFVSVSLHGKKINLPKDQRHWPSVKMIADREKSLKSGRE